MCFHPVLPTRAHVHALCRQEALWAAKAMEASVVFPLPSHKFWIFVVTVCFSVASIMIQKSFQNWAESPVATTIETLSIEDFLAPKERKENF